ncbi:Cobalt-precorrin-4 C(11)-methyltransferase [Geodia barretti]|uniref:Cobalt-precorrin-4 C(11)-methyltransferase n=1 Tax=Geodia barretti TaxID=519541 RepID=A0AA35T608_GEOBA|nr:Cobalt-precorrin-4 C(11)-methyltransferase [Geodia barretti]
MTNAGKVYIIGAGPGDPELLTLKAKRLIETSDVIIYADSLVPEEIAGFARAGAQIYGSKDMSLDAIMSVTLQAVADGKTVSRIQSGDPSLYGATLEQMRILESEQVDYEIIPGVSAAFAAAAVLKVELTVPEVSQTVIMTRAEGRVAMPEGEDLVDLARHGSTLVIFLSVTRMFRIANQLQEAGYPADTPVAVVYRVGWPEELVIRGTLEDIAQKVRDAKITLQALIIVGQAVNPSLLDPNSGEKVAVSHLYSDEYTHLYRRAGHGDHADADRADLYAPEAMRFNRKPSHP